MAKKTIFTNGCFDILHRGHIELLKFCKSYGRVIVGLNSDKSVRKLKGPSRPVFSENDRKFMLESCKYVDKVHVFEEDTPINLISKLKPDIIVKGGDYEGKEVVGQDIADELKLVKFVDEKSTTQTIENIQQGK